MDYDAYKHLCILTVLSSLAPLRLMLADTSKPRGCDATLASVGTLSEGFERFVTAPLYLVGYVRWDARSDNRCSFSSFRQSLQQLSGRNCPIHRSLFCCGREQARKERRFRLGVQRIEDPHHPREYREVRSSAEMRKLLNRKIAEQEGKCAICRITFLDYNEVVPDHMWFKA
jgi:hypothetical protein